MRTPLNTVFMGLDILKDELQRQACKQESMDLLQEIKSSCKSSLTILDELLDYDKLDAGILGLDRTLVCAWDLLQECLDPFIIQ
eukprot:gene38413-50437_t